MRKKKFKVQSSAGKAIARNKEMFMIFMNRDATIKPDRYVQT